METGEKAYHAYCPALKGCHTWGRTYDEALANVREAVELYVDDLAVAVNLCAYERRATWRDRPSCSFGALHSDGFLLVRTRGSHHIYWHPDGRRVVVAYHRVSDTFPIGTLKAMIEDAGWTEADLLNLGLLR